MSKYAPPKLKLIEINSTRENAGHNNTTRDTEPQLRFP